MSTADPNRIGEIINALLQLFFFMKLILQLLRTEKNSTGFLAIAKKLTIFETFLKIFVIKILDQDFD